jgi:acyl carrier protein
MTKEELFEKLQDILAEEFEIDKSKITPEARLFEDLDFDSIDAVNLIVKMKGYLKDKVDPEQFKSVRTIQDTIDILHPLV